MLVGEDGGQGWIVASAPELLRVLSQRRDADGQRQMIRAAVPAWAPGPPHQASPRQNGSEKVNAVACWPYMRSISMWAC